MKEGKCERIKLNEWEYHIASTGVVSCYSNTRSGMRLDCEALLSEDWELVEPVKEYEEIEVVRYYCNICTKTFLGIRKCCGDHTIKLTGTIKKEIKSKVKRREELTHAKHFISLGSGIPLSARIFAEWTE